MRRAEGVRWMRQSMEHLPSTARVAPIFANPRKSKKHAGIFSMLRALVVVERPGNVNAQYNTN